MFTVGISEVALPVENLKDSIRFYSEVVKLQLETESEDGAFLWAGAPGQQQRVILLTRAYLGGPNARRPSGGLAEGARWEHVHFALRVPREKLEAAVEHVRGKGVDVVGPVRFDQAIGMKAVSYYFRDPDGHLVEFWSPDPA